MSHLTFHNDTVSLNHIWFQSHKNMIATVCIELGQHNKIEELMVDVNKVRDKLNMARDERKSWMTDHNASVKAEMKTGAESAEVADELISTLLTSGGITFGGIGKGDDSSSSNRKAKSDKKKSMRKVDMNATRRR